MDCDNCRQAVTENFTHVSTVDSEATVGGGRFLPYFYVLYQYVDKTAKVYNDEANTSLRGTGVPRVEWLATFSGKTNTIHCDGQYPKHQSQHRQWFEVGTALHCREA